MKVINIEISKSDLDFHDRCKEIRKLLTANSVRFKTFSDEKSYNFVINGNVPSRIIQELDNI